MYPKSNTGNIRAIGILPPYVSGTTKTALLFCAAGRLALQLYAFPDIREGRIFLRHDKISQEESGK